MADRGAGRGGAGGREVRRRKMRRRLGDAAQRALCALCALALVLGTGPQCLAAWAEADGADGARPPSRRRRRGTPPMASLKESTELSGLSAPARSPSPSCTSSSSPSAS